MRRRGKKSSSTHKPVDSCLDKRPHNKKHHSGKERGCCFSVGDTATTRHLSSPLFLLLLPRHRRRRPARPCLSLSLCSFPRRPPPDKVIKTSPSFSPLLSPKRGSRVGEGGRKGACEKSLQARTTTIHPFSPFPRRLSERKKQWRLVFFLSPPSFPPISVEEEEEECMLQRQQ